MSRRRVGPQRVQTPKPHAMREIFAVRRPISPESHDFFHAVATNLKPELVNAARIFEAPTLSVTVIGFTRIDKRNRHKSVPTTEIIKRVPSAATPIEVTLGELGIFGSGSKNKLAFGLTSVNPGELEEEVRDFEAAFKNNNWPLKKDHNNPSGEPTPHCSVALMYEDHVRYFNDERELARLGNIGLMGLDLDTPIILDAVSRVPGKSATQQLA